MKVPGRASDLAANKNHSAPGNALSEKGVVPLLGVVSASNIFAGQFAGADLWVILFHQLRKAHFGSDPAKTSEGKPVVIRRGGLREGHEEARLSVVPVNRLEFQSAAPGREAG